MIEEWRPIVGFENSYEISNFGQVRSIARIVPHAYSQTLTIKSRILKCSITGPEKYCLVNLWKANKNYPRYIHSLVLEAFVGPRPEKADGCHTDGNRTNNHLENLRWDTRTGNMSDTVRNGKSTRGERQNHVKLKEQQVREIRASSASNTQLAKEFGMSISSISSIRRGENWGWLK